MADERVVTELVIDADTSGADKYSQAMDKAGQSSRDFSEKQGAIGLAIAGVSAAMVAAIASINSGLEYVAKLNKGLADLATQARNTGLSLADVQGLKFVGAIAGLTDAQFNNGLERSAQLLNDASRNSNSLSKELAANGISIREANGQLISQNKLLGIAADLVSRARNPGDQTAIAQMLGFTKEWIPLLEQGPVAMAGLTDEARRAGAVLDDEVIQRAVEFDKEWRKSSVEMEYYLKSALLSLLPYVDDLIDRLAGFVKSIDAAKIAAAAEDHAREVFQPGEDALKEAGVGGIRIGMTAATEDAIKAFTTSSAFSLEYWRAAGQVIASSVQVIRPEDMKWSVGAAPVRDTSSATIGNTIRAKAESDAWAAAGNSWKAYNSAVLSGAVTAGAGYSKVVSRTNEAADAYDRAVESITKHTARTEADVLAVGKGAGAQEELRASYQLTMAAQLAGIPVTQRLKDQIQDLAQDAGEAAAALKLVRAQADATFVSQTQLLSAGDKAAAGAMYNLYGDQWQSHMDDALAKQIKMNVLTQQVGDAAATLGNNLIQAFASGKSGLDALLPALSSFGSALTSIGTDSLKSGISGMLKGLGTTGFDPASLGIGAVGMGISLVSSIIGGDQKQRAQLEAAKKAWKEAGPAFQKFLTEMSGGVQGDLAASIESARQSMQSLADKAWDAKDYAALAQIQSNFVKFELSQAARFQAMFSATMQGLADGLGMDSPFSKAVEAVKGQLQTVQKFIDDAVTSNTTEYMSTSVDVGAAKATSMSYLLTLLQTAPKLSDVQTGMLHIQGTATALQSALTQLGMSAQDAAYWINAGVGTAIAQLKKTFEEGLASRLNTATGKSYFNDTAALIAQHAQDLADAAMLGTDAGVVSRLFHAEAQKIVDDAGLVGDAFKDFTRQFPELAGIVTESSDALAAAAKTQQDALNSSAKSIVDYVNGLMTGSQAGLSPQDRFTTAQATYTQKLALAQSGNVDAMATIAQDFETYRAAAREMFGSTEQYQQILAAGINQLLTLPAVQNTTDPVVQAMRDVLLAVQAGNVTLANVQTATQLNVAKTAEAAAQAQRTADLQASANNLSVTANALTASANYILDQQYAFLASINNLQATAADQLALLRAALAPSAVAVGANPEFGGIGGVLSNQAIDALNKIVWNTYAAARNLQLLATNSSNRGPLPGAPGGVYAQGGLVTGPGTGTSDSINAWLSNREFVIPNAQVERLGVDFFEQIRAGRTPMMPMPVPMRGLNDNGDMRAVLGELRALKGELAAIKGNTGRAVTVAAEGAQQIRESIDRGNDLQADTNKRLRRSS